MLVKYPRTFHLPWSPGATSDDKILHDTKHFVGREIVVTEKMDGENTTLYHDNFHARSLDSADHPSQHWLKNYHAGIKHLIPAGYRICGENMYAKHSIEYSNLPAYFLVFSVWYGMICLSWDDTITFTEKLGLHLVPFVYRGIYDTRATSSALYNWSGCPNGTLGHEGYVIRVADAFEYADFGKSVAKYVRRGHVQTDTHWKHNEPVKNGLGR